MGDPALASSCPGAAARPVLAFDLDDTLWDTVATLRAAHEAMLLAAPELPAAQRSPEGFRVAMAATLAAHPELSHDFTFLRKETLRRLLGCSEAAERIFSAWFAARNAPAFLPGAVEALRELRRRGYRLCAISNGNACPLEIPELRGAFDFSVSAAEAGAPKPDPRIFRLAAERAGVPCSSMVYVGDDYEKDVLGARAAGMRAVWVRGIAPRPEQESFLVFASAEPEGVSQADWEVSSVSGLLQLPSIL